MALSTPHSPTRPHSPSGPTKPARTEPVRPARSWPRTVSTTRLSRSVGSSARPIVAPKADEVGLDPLRTVSLRQVLTAAAIRGPLAAFEHIGLSSDGRIVRPNLGLARPYIVTDPEHVQHVLRDRADVYRRDGMMWNPIRRLLGNGIITDGASWEPRRAIVAPLFAGRRVSALVDDLADAVNECVEELLPAARAGRVFDVGDIMSAIADHAFGRTLFGGRMSDGESLRFTRAVETAFRSVAGRIVLPFVPDAVPMPGDRAFKRAVREVDDIVLPLVRRARAEGGDRHDILSALLSARDAEGQALSDVEVRDDAVSMFAAGFETSAVALTWLWVVLAEHPRVEQELRREVDEVVGAARPDARHLADLRYTRMVVQEVLRIYSPGWIIPRLATVDDDLDGVTVSAGSTVVISPYLTHRLGRVWPDPHRFDPVRFAPEAVHDRHRFAYLPFGGGPHGCVGNHFFTLEAQLAVAAVLSRFRVHRHGGGRVTPAIGASLRPRQRVAVVLEPRHG